jgi:hypothetical protein
LFWLYGLKVLLLWLSHTQFHTFKPFIMQVKFSNTALIALMFVIFTLFYFSFQCNAPSPEKTEAEVEMGRADSLAALPNTLEKKDKFDTETLRSKIMEFSDKEKMEITYDYYRACNSEYGSELGNMQYGAFQNFNFATDSLDDKMNKIPKKQLQAEVSVTVARSRKFYKPHPKYGYLFIIGLQFDISSDGEVTKEREYLIFEKGGHCIYTTDSKESSYKYFTFK